MKHLGGTLFLILGFTSVFAQDVPQSLLACSAITADEQRLTCYDDLARSATPTSFASVNNWQIETETDPIDDSTNVFISAEATGDSTTSAYGDLPYLTLRCLQGEIHAIINWQEFLGSDTIQTTYRIGDADAITDTWYISSTNQAAFYSINEPANLEFIEKLVNSKGGTLVAQVTPYSEPIKTAIFNIANLSKVVGQLYEACS